jgi:hypothetical protein
MVEMGTRTYGCVGDLATIKNNAEGDLGNAGRQWQCQRCTDAGR